MLFFQSTAILTISRSYQGGGDSGGYGGGGGGYGGGGGGGYGGGGGGYGGGGDNFGGGGGDRMSNLGAGLRNQTWGKQHSRAALMLWTIY
ncbi:hypothetical protein IMZ48_08470 [Candidatus Bathyarchaeota archaeon]|nr:hypothetical protein [Candidatus Bathyarchaeota archaeon]